ncbi:MAG TPA: NAD(P)-binding protein [Caulobacteraceae bacterium]|jgi:spermidine dehydrogenase
MSADNDDKSLGMDRPIRRRDFLQGAAVAVGSLGTGLSAKAADTAWPQDLAGYYPPVLTGMRGSHPGSFENAHRLRDGNFWSDEGPGRTLDETYDLIIVGGGISGLSAAHFYRQARPSARILILDNHDDFGGHAKRNEFHLGGRLHLMNGGTLEIDSPRPYSAVAGGLIQSLGIDPVGLSRTSDHNEIYRNLGLGHGVFFDRETFGTDALVTGAPSLYYGTGGSWPDFAARAPLPQQARDDIVRIETAKVDYMPGLTSAQKKDALSRMSYRDYLGKVAKVHPLVLAFYQTHTQGEWGVGIDAVSALDCWGFFMPGFQGLKLDPGPAPRMSYTPAGYSQGGSYTFHFPDGNATIARLLVRDLVPAAVPGSDCRDVVTTRVDYAQLDRPQNPVRIRLSSACVGARNLGDVGHPDGVEIAYVRGDRVLRVRGRACILASWNMMIPYICPQLPEAQKAALHQIVKTPLVYTTVALRNWTAFQKLGVSGITAPGGYHTSFQLNPPVDIGDYAAARDPEQPILIRMTRTPCHPGLSEHEQNKAGRAELMTTSFDTFEREIRAQLGRTLQGGGFDPARDITAITVNRWPHGYAPEWNPLWGQVYPPGQAPNEIGRQRFGLIAIANSDAGAAAYTDCAIDQAHRAVGELLAL